MNTQNISIKKEKEFLCVEFPALVKNPSKAIQLLGGIESLTKALNNPETHPTLNFRPNDIYSKPILGNKKERNIFIFKAVIDDDDNVSVDFVGRPRQTFSFDNLADFSFLNVEKNKQGDFESLEKLNRLDTIDFEAMLARPLPLYIQPLTFSRVEKSIDYAYKFKDQQKKTYISTIKYIFYYGESIPTQRPNDKVFERFREKCSRFYREFEKCFNEKIFWSTSEILARGVIKTHILKKYISAFAYTFRNGPWRSLWIRIGFDPTMNPAAKPFQLIEVRSGKYCQEASVSSKRGNVSFNVDSLPNTNQKSQRDSLEATLDFSQDNPKSTKPLNIATKFTPGVLPMYYNSFFHVHSIEMEEVQAILHSNDGKETKCTFQDGWLVPGSVGRIREFVLEDIKKTLKDNMDESLTSSNVLVDSIFE